MLQLLTPESELTISDDARQILGNVDIPDPRVLQDMLRDMEMGRRLDAEATALQRVGELSLWAPQAGQEAGQIGVRYALRERDMVFPSYREHALAIALGVPLDRMLALFRSSALCDWDADVLRFQPYNLIVGGAVPIAVGYSLGQALTDEDAATITFHGDGASAQGDVMEAMNLAAVTHAPVVIWCQNNGYAISEPNDHQFAAPLTDRAQAYGLASVLVDGNDVIACHAVAAQALERARTGGGPTFVEAVTYRASAHTTADDPTKYRTREEEASWQAKDPIVRLQRYLDGIGVGRPEGLDDELNAFGEHVRQECRAVPDPDLEQSFSLALTELTADLVDQRAEAKSWEKTLAAGERA